LIMQTLTDSASPALALARREEVLEICYWFRGEGFGDRYSPAKLKPFLPCPEPEIELTLRGLVEQGYLAEAGGDEVLLTDAGLKLAARLFADGFTELQQSGHGECHEGCCDGDDHSRCSHG